MFMLMQYYLVLAQTHTCLVYIFGIDCNSYCVRCFEPSEWRLNQNYAIYS